MHGVWRVSLLLLLVSGVARAGTISLTIVEPRTGETQGSSLHVVVHVDSTSQIDAMEARVEGVSGPMLPFSAGNWSTRLQLTDIPYGEHTVTVTARDSQGDTATASKSFFLDRRPRVLVQSPFSQAVLTNRVHVEATCIDDDPTPCMLEVQLVQSPVADSREPVLASGTGTVTADLDVSGFASRGQGYVVVRTVRRSSNDSNYGYKIVPFYVFEHPRLAKVFEAPGVVLAFDAERVLLQRDFQEYILSRRADGETLWRFEITDVRDSNASGLLTPAGAYVFAADTVGREWRNGEVLEHSVLEATGPFALISTSDGYFVHDYRHGTDHPLILPPGEQMGARDLTPRGEVVFSRWPEDLNTDTRYALYRFRQGKVEQLAAGEQPGVWMRSDGTHTLYYRAKRWTYSEEYAPILNVDGVDTALGAPTRFASNIRPLQAAAREGYIAFNAFEGGVNQVFRRNPQGDVEMLTSLGTDSLVEELAPNGELIFINDEKRYFARPGQTPIELGTPVGRIEFRDGEWYVRYGTTVFQVQFAAGERPVPGPAWAAPPVPDSLDAPEEEVLRCGCTEGGRGSALWLLAVLSCLLGHARARNLGNLR